MAHCIALFSGNFLCGNNLILGNHMYVLHEVFSRKWIIIIENIEFDELKLWKVENKFYEIDRKMPK